MITHSECACYTLNWRMLRRMAQATLAREVELRDLVHRLRTILKALDVPHTREIRQVLGEADQLVAEPAATVLNDYRSTGDPSLVIGLADLRAWHVWGPVNDMRIGPPTRWARGFADLPSIPSDIEAATLLAAARAFRSHPAGGAL